MTTALEKRITARKAATPSAGFNVVLFDDYEEPGDELTVVSHHATKAEAEKVIADRKAAGSRAVYVVYGSTPGGSGGGDKAPPPEGEEEGGEESVVKSEAGEGMHALHALLGRLQAFREAYQHLHWGASGPSSYADHLLFERLYDGVAAEVDAAAEKITGLTGAAPAGTLMAALGEGPAQPTAVDMLAAELEFCERDVPDARGSLALAGELSEGLDNWLQGLADAHEQHVYLLRQRVGSVLMEKAGDHKYLKREGTPGKYRYVYATPQAKARGAAMRGEDVGPGAHGTGLKAPGHASQATPAAFEAHHAAWGLDQHEQAARDLRAHAARFPDRNDATANVHHAYQHLAAAHEALGNLKGMRGNPTYGQKALNHQEALLPQALQRVNDRVADHGRALQEMVQKASAVVKAVPLGGKYHRRVTGEDGRHRYFYDAASYNKSPGAHLAGNDVLRDRLRKEMQNRMASCAPGERPRVEDLEKRYSPEDVRTVLAELEGQGLSKGTPSSLEDWLGKAGFGEPPDPEDEEDGEPDETGEEDPNAPDADEDGPQDGEADPADEDDVEKAGGPGSRGGKVIGRTSSGRAIYAPKAGAFKKKPRDAATDEGGQAIQKQHAAAAAAHVQQHAAGYSAEDHEHAARHHAVMAEAAMSRGKTAEAAAHAAVGTEHNHQARQVAKSVAASAAGDPDAKPDNRGPGAKTGLHKPPVRGKAEAGQEEVKAPWDRPTPPPEGGEGEEDGAQPEAAGAAPAPGEGGEEDAPAPAEQGAAKKPQKGPPTMAGKGGGEEDAPAAEAGANGGGKAPGKVAGKINGKELRDVTPAGKVPWEELSNPSSKGSRALGRSAMEAHPDFDAADHLAAHDHHASKNAQAQAAYHAASAAGDHAEAFKQHERAKHHTMQMLSHDAAHRQHTARGAAESSGAEHSKKMQADFHAFRNGRADDNTKDDNTKSADETKAQKGNAMTGLKGWMYKSNIPYTDGAESAASSQPGGSPALENTRSGSGSQEGIPYTSGAGGKGTPQIGTGAPPSDGDLDVGSNNGDLGDGVQSAPGASGNVLERTGAGSETTVEATTGKVPAGDTDALSEEGPQKVKELAEGGPPMQMAATSTDELAARAATDMDVRGYGKSAHAASLDMVKAGGRERAQQVARIKKGAGPDVRVGVGVGVPVQRAALPDPVQALLKAANATTDDLVESLLKKGGDGGIAEEPSMGVGPQNALTRKVVCKGCNSQVPEMFKAGACPACGADMSKAVTSGASVGTLRPVLRRDIHAPRGVLLKD